MDNVANMLKINDKRYNALAIVLKNTVERASNAITTNASRALSFNWVPNVHNRTISKVYRYTINVLFERDIVDAPPVIYCPNFSDISSPNDESKPKSSKFNMA